MAKMNKSKRNRQTDVEEEIFTEVPVVDVEETTDVEDLEVTDSVDVEDPVLDEMLEDILADDNTDVEEVVSEEDAVADVEEATEVVSEETVSTVEVTEDDAEEVVVTEEATSTDEVVEDAEVAEETIESEEAVEPEEVVELSELDNLLLELEDKLHPRELENYSTRSLREFKETGVRQTLTPRGNYKYSRVRSFDITNWTADELLDWAEGRIEAHPSVPENVLLDELYSRWMIPSNYTEEDAKRFALDYVFPDTLPSGELVNDRRREACELKDMTFAMLCSIRLGEVNTRHSTTDAHERLKVVIRSTSDEDVVAALEQYKSGRPLMTNNIEQVVSVLDARKKLFKDHGAQLTELTIGNNQKALYNHLRRICKLDYAEFAEAWRSILRYVDNNYAELFVANRVRRGWGTLELSPGHLATFDRLLTLLVGTRNPSTRHVDIKTFKLDYILEFIATGVERENILSFYQQ